jgi:hypothetical protein
VQITTNLNKKLGALTKSRRARWIAAGGLAFFIVINVGIGLIYQNKTLPNTTINNKKFASVPYADLAKAMERVKLLPSEATLIHKSTSATYKTSDLGAAVDSEKVVEELKKHRSFLPLANFLFTQPITAAVKIDSRDFDEAFVQMAQTFKKDPVNAQISQVGGSFSMKPESSGYKLDSRKVREALVATLGSNRNRVELPAVVIPPAVTQDKLKASLGSLQKQQNTSITLHYKDKAKKLSKQEIGGLYAESGTTPVLSDQLVQNLVTNTGKGFGIRVENSGQAVVAIKDSLSKSKTLDFTLKQLIVRKTYSYCIQLRGVDSSNLGALESKLASTYADARGWSLGGQVSFAHVTSGCDFTVWLAAANQVPGFGPICDTTWSCTARPNVVINYDRWTGASPAWNAAGGSLEDYRAMVINHETGHWLGFGHRNCTGAGQQAPVMQQQSISLQGCTFNAWPTASETASLRRILGL